MNPEPSLHKAAVLVASLDADTADLLLAQMPQDQADAVRSEVLRLGELDPAEQQSVIDEFFRIGPPQPEKNLTGMGVSDPLLRRAALPIDEYQSENFESAEAVAATHHHSHPNHAGYQANEAPFSFLHDAEPETLIPLLEREHPQAIALVLAHLPQQRAGNVLARLPAAMQTDVIRRLVDLEETDPHVLRDVEAAVEAWLIQRQPGRRRVAGMAAVSAILNASDRTARRQILNNLAVHDRPLAHKLTPPTPPRRFTFAEVCQFPPEALLHVVEAADRRSVILALAGAPAEIIQPLIDELEPEAAYWIEHGLEHLGPLRLADFDRAQNDTAELAGQLYAQGKLPGLGAEHLTAMA
jgi:flagellar motor switch protein FliG